MKVLCISLIALWVLAIAKPAEATVWAKWTDQSIQQTMEGPVEVQYPSDFGEFAEFAVYQFGVDLNSPGFLTTDSGADYHDVAIPNRLQIEGGRTDPGDSWFDPYTNYPIYVRLSFKARNSGNTEWTDFHLRGLENCSVYKVQGFFEPYWDTFVNDPGINGWDSYYGFNTENPAYPDETTGPPIPNGGDFISETWLVVDPGSDHWKVEIWPTPVPEPLSIFLFGMGLALIRRIGGR